jgi:membrane protease YdiL (CAAX protease family)
LGWALLALAISIGIAVYARVAQKIARDGGRVRATEFGLGELLMSVVFASFFGMLMFGAIQRQAEGKDRVNIDTIVPNSLLFVLFSAGILAFLKYGRRLRLGHLFGLDQTKPLAVAGWALGLILAALPLANSVNLLTYLLFNGQAKPQPLVELFNEVAQKGDRVAMAKILFAGVVIAPVCEEFLFRGFFYGVWKHFMGPLGAGLAACLLFAAFHTNLAAFAGLFILAVCLNLAYERTGSLLVPIAMHASFNLANLLVLFSQAGPTLPE